MDSFPHAVYVVKADNLIDKLFVDLEFYLPAPWTADTQSAREVNRERRANSRPPLSPPEVGVDAIAS